MPMRTECKHFESRTYPNGDTVRKCNLDLAPDAPWRCPEHCPRYERRLAATFVLRDHKKLRRAPELVLSDRVQHRYPQLVTAVVERMFRVDNPHAKPGLRRILNEERKRAGISRRDLARDGWAGLRTFG